jgi:DNA segregation ATPase FtsK/SpoIIIE, S-DNA-T family
MTSVRRRRRTRPRPATRQRSIYDPIHFGIDENGDPVEVTLMYRNLLNGGEPGSGKSSLCNTIIAHAALSSDCRLWLFDGKRVELGPWRPVADKFVGNSITDALAQLRELQAEMEIRYALLEAVGRRQIVRSDGLDVVLCVIDELAYYSVTIGSKEEQDEFRNLVRDLVARGRAAGIIVLAAHLARHGDTLGVRVVDPLAAIDAHMRFDTGASGDLTGWTSGRTPADVAMILARAEQIARDYFGTHFPAIPW